MAKNHRKAARESLTQGTAPVEQKKNRLRFFEWEKLNWWISFVPGVLAALLMSVGEFGLAEIAIAVTALLLIVSAITTKWNTLAKFWAVVVISLFFAIFILQVDSDRLVSAEAARQDALRKPFGVLSADQQVFSGQDNCAPDVKSNFPFALHLGETTVRFKSLPQTAIVLGGKAILRADKQPNGKLGVSLSLFDEQGVIMADIDNNHYQISSEIFKKVQTDFHGFVLYDNHDDMVLSVRIINSHEAIITGTLFYLAGIHISDDALILPGRNSLMGGCIASSGTAMRID
jgi:hypothetical protein